MLFPIFNIEQMVDIWENNKDQIKIQQRDITNSA